MKRKRLTQIEKSVGRWFNRHKIFFWAIVVLLDLATFLGPLVILTYLHESINVLFLLFGILSLASIMLGIDFFVAMMPAKLPEGCLEEVERRIEEYPKLADRLEKMMKEAQERDDGLELRRFLSKIDTLEASKRNVAYSSCVEKIAMQEKDLGLRE